jgi:hypothetical protein
MSKRLIQFTVVCTVAALVTSCATPTYKLQEGTYKIYEGTSSPPDKIATLLINEGYSVGMIDGFPPPPGSWQESVVDGKWQKKYGGSLWDGSLRIELLPGEHTISVGFCEPYRASVGQLVITFHVEAGKVYRVVKSEGRNWSWNAWVEEIKRGVIPQVTQPDRAAEIYFIREWALFLGGVKYKLFFDGVDFFRIGAGKYTMIKADPGKHSVDVRLFDGYSTDRKEFDFQPNQKYYLAVTLLDNRSMAIKLLSTSDGEAAVKKCTYVPY